MPKAGEVPTYPYTHRGGQAAILKTHNPGYHPSGAKQSELSPRSNVEHYLPCTRGKLLVGGTCHGRFSFLNQLPGSSPALYIFANNQEVTFTACVNQFSGCFGKRRPLKQKGYELPRNLRTTTENIVGNRHRAAMLNLPTESCRITCNLSASNVDSLIDG